MFLGIDVGTGGTRAVLIDRTGQVLGQHSAEHAGIASGTNNALARTGSLLAVAALPVAVGLTGDTYVHRALFLNDFRTAVLICILILVLGSVIAFVGIRRPSVST